MAWRTIPILGVMLTLAACGPDTYFPPSDMERAGTWQAEGVNERNLRAQIADPAHLTRGAAAATERGQPGSAAIRALEAGQRPALPRGLSDIGGATTNAGVSSGGGGGAN